MPLFNQITIIGVGLMGGSLAKAVRKKHISRKIIGFFRDKHKLNKAKKEKIVDAGYLKLKQAIQNSDLIIIALPISQIINFLNKIKKIAVKDVLIIDVGSTKYKIISLADKLNLNFVGTHPLAGSEKRGFSYSCDTLFDNSLVIITPTKKTNKKAINKIKLFWRKLSTKVMTLPAQQHDKIISLTSHLPHAIAFSLINTLKQSYLKFSSTGLKDTTRIALSDATVWTDIFLSNKRELLQSLNSFERQIQILKNTIIKEKRNRLIYLLNKSKLKREKINN